MRARVDGESSGRGPDLGDLVVCLLVGVLSDLRDRLYEDDYPVAGDLVADLVEAGDSYLCCRTDAVGGPKGP